MKCYYKKNKSYIMVEKLQQILSDSKGARWTALFIVAFTMMMGYFITDVMSPLEVLLTKPLAAGGLGWSSDDYGFFSGSYGLINVFLLMLFFGGIILDNSLHWCLGLRVDGDWRVHKVFWCQSRLWWRQHLSEYHYLQGQLAIVGSHSLPWFLHIRHGLRDLWYHGF